MQTKQENKARQAAGVTSALLTAVLLVPSYQAIAQPAALEEIIVTAERRETSLQDTPVAVSTLTAENIESTGVYNAQELQNIVPSLAAAGNRGSGNANLNLSIRGIGQRGSRAETGRGVGVYFDDIYYPVTYGSNVAFADLARVEVLRGPQGTLFGRNNVGGAVRYFTNRPELDETYGSIQGTLGSLNRMDVELMGNFALSDTTAARLVYSRQDRDGYMDWVDINGNETGRDALGATEDEILRASLRFEPSSDLTVDLQYQRIESWNNGQTQDAVSLTAPGASFSGRLSSAIANETGTGLQLNDPRLITGPFDTLDTCLLDGDGLFSTRVSPNTNAANPIDRCNTDRNSEIDSFSLTVDYALTDAVDFKSITGISQVETQAYVDWSVMGVYFRDETADIDFWSQEFQFSGLAMEDRLNWVAGANLFHMTADQNFDVWAVNPALVDYLDNSQFQNVDEDAWGIFAQGTYALTDRMNLTLGARYTEEEKSFEVYRSNRIDGFVVDANATWSDTNVRVVLDYNWSDDVMTYISYSDAFKSGAFPTNLNANGCSDALYGDPTICDDERELISNADIEPMDPEQVENLEIGLRSEINDRLRLNLTYFEMDYTDLQRRQRQEDPNDADCPNYVGSGDTPNGICEGAFVPGSISAEISGLEAESLFALTDSLTLTGNLAMIETKVTDNQGAPALAIGDPLETAPELNYSLGLNHLMSFENGYSLNSNLTYSRKGGYIPPFGGGPANMTDTVRTLSGRITLTNPDETWSLALGGTNLTDQIYEYGYDAWESFFGELTQEGRAAPRAWYLDFKYNLN